MHEKRKELYLMHRMWVAILLLSKREKWFYYFYAVPLCGITFWVLYRGAFLLNKIIWILTHVILKSYNVECSKGL